MTLTNFLQQAVERPQHCRMSCPCRSFAGRGQVLVECVPYVKRGDRIDRQPHDRSVSAFEAHRNTAIVAIRGTAPSSLLSRIVDAHRSISAIAHRHRRWIAAHSLGEGPSSNIVSCAFGHGGNGRGGMWPLRTSGVFFGRRPNGHQEGSHISSRLRLARRRAAAPRGAELGRQKFIGHALSQPDSGTQYSIGLHLGEDVGPLRDSAPRHFQCASEIRVSFTEDLRSLVFGHNGASLRWYTLLSTPVNANCV